MSRPEPVFEALWHAQLFAITVHLNAAGKLHWPAWTELFGATLQRHGLHKALNGGDDYFLAWLETLEGYLAHSQMASPQELQQLKQAWTQAYQDTPHGRPVRLETPAP